MLSLPASTVEHPDQPLCGTASRARKATATLWIESDLQGALHLPPRSAVSQVKYHATAQPLRGKWAAPIPHKAVLCQIAPVATLAHRLVGRPLRALRVDIRGLMSGAPACLPGQGVRVRAWFCSGAARAHHTGCSKSGPRHALVRKAHCACTRAAPAVRQQARKPAPARPAPC